MIDAILGSAFRKHFAFESKKLVPTKMVIALKVRASIITKWCNPFVRRGSTQLRIESPVVIEQNFCKDGLKIVEKNNIFCRYEFMW